MFPLLVLALADHALAADPAAWQGSRWLLAVEEVFPRELLWQSITNEEFLAKAAQVRAIVDCAEAEAEGKRTVVRCRVEAMAIQATPHGNTPSEREVANSLVVIEEMAQRLTGVPIEVSFDKKNRVSRVDALLPEPRNDRERTSSERLRQLAADLTAAWSFETPPAWEGTWIEYNPKVLRVPGLPMAGGVSSITHSAAMVDGRTLIQSVGSGLVQAYYEPWELESGSKVVGDEAQDQATGGSINTPDGSVAVTKYAEGTTPGGAKAVGTTPQTVPYDVSVRSVAVVEAGLVTERVWSTAGKGTPSGVSAFEGVNLWYTGHLRKLAPGEVPDLGPTRMVSPPGVEIAGLPSWDPMGS